MKAFWFLTCGIASGCFSRGAQPLVTEVSPVPGSALLDDQNVRLCFNTRVLAAGGANGLSAYYGSFGPISGRVNSLDGMFVDMTSSYSADDNCLTLRLGESFPPGARTIELRI